MEKQQNPTVFDIAIAGQKAISETISRMFKTNEESTMNANTEYTAIKDELTTAKEALDAVLEQVNNLHTRFTAIDFDEDSDEEKEEIEERIAKLEDVLDELDDEDSQAVIQKKIDVLNEQLNSADNTGELRDDLKELFAEIAGDLADVDLDTD